MLTQSQLKTYQYIKKFMERHQHAPTAAEIAQGIGIQSRGVVHRYLKALEEAGYIELLPHRHRNIVLSPAQPSQHSLPLIGYIAAGHPIEAITQSEAIDFSALFSGAKRFALKVKGDSMIEEGILDGDLVICEHSESAENGQIVVALIDGQETTLKRIHFKPTHNTITLIPENSQYQAQEYSSERIQIQGIYIGLIRQTH